MRVFVFSFGFGKRLVRLQVGRHRLPRLRDPARRLRQARGRARRRPDQRGHPRASATGRDFLSRPRWQRFLVYLAGPAMNALLTITVLTGFYMVGFAVEASRFDRPIVGAVDAGSPAEKAGLVPGDEILVDRRQGAALVGGGAVPHPAAPRGGARPAACGAARRQREVALRSEATRSRRSARSASTRWCASGEVLPGPAGRGGGPAAPTTRSSSIDGTAAALVLGDPADRGRRRRARAGVPLSGATARCSSSRITPEGLGRRADASGSRRRPSLKKFGPAGALAEAAALDLGHDHARPST